jgi:hypothetical protein
MPEKNPAAAASVDKQRDSGDDSDDEILEEDPDGRWQKRRDKVCRESGIPHRNNI